MVAEWLQKLFACIPGICAVKAAYRSRADVAGNCADCEGTQQWQALKLWLSENTHFLCKSIWLCWRNLTWAVTTYISIWMDNLQTCVCVCVCQGSQAPVTSTFGFDRVSLAESSECNVTSWTALVLAFLLTSIVLACFSMFQLLGQTFLFNSAR